MEEITFKTWQNGKKQREFPQHEDGYHKHTPHSIETEGFPLTTRKELEQPLSPQFPSSTLEVQGKAMRQEEIKDIQTKQNATDEFSCTHTEAQREYPGKPLQSGVTTSAELQHARLAHGVSSKPH